MTERIPYRKTTEVVGFSFEADLHCVPCTKERFGEIVTFKKEGGPDHAYILDGEGNPIHPVFLGDTTGDDTCGDCFAKLDE